MLHAKYFCKKHLLLKSLGAFGFKLILFKNGLNPPVFIKINKLVNGQIIVYTVCHFCNKLWTFFFWNVLTELFRVLFIHISEFI